MLFITFLILLLQQEIPFKPKDEFAVDIKLDLQAKENSPYTVNYNETVADRNRRNSGPLPYLIVHVRFLKFSEQEVKVKGYNNRNETIVNKRASEGLAFRLDLGFTDDLKDRVTPYEFTIYTLGEDKNERTRIHLFIQEDGTFLVNGEVRGKF